MIRILAAVIIAGGLWACRQDEPAGDPKTPANSPLPKIDKNDDDQKSSPLKLPSLGDAGK